MQHNLSSWRGEQASPPPAETLHTRSTQLPRELGCVPFAVWVFHTASPPSFHCSPSGPPGLQGQTPFV